MKEKYYSLHHVFGDCLDLQNIDGGNDDQDDLTHPNFKNLKKSIQTRPHVRSSAPVMALILFPMIIKEVIVASRMT